MVFTSKVEPKTKKKKKQILICHVFFLPDFFCFLWAHSPRVSMRPVVCTFTFPSVASSAFPSCVRTICGWWFPFEAATGICCSSGKERRQTIKVHGGQPPFPQLTLSPDCDKDTLLSRTNKEVFFLPYMDKSQMRIGSSVARKWSSILLEYQFFVNQAAALAWKNWLMEKLVRLFMTLVILSALLLWFWFLSLSISIFDMKHYP